MGLFGQTILVWAAVWSANVPVGVLGRGTGQWVYLRVIPFLEVVYMGLGLGQTEP